MAHWSIGDSVKMYNLENWGADFFSSNKKGNLCVHPALRQTYYADLSIFLKPKISAALG